MLTLAKVTKELRRAIIRKNALFGLLITDLVRPTMSGRVKDKGKRKSGLLRGSTSIYQSLFPDSEFSSLEQKETWFNKNADDLFVPICEKLWITAIEAKKSVYAEIEPLRNQPQPGFSILPFHLSPLKSVKI